MIYLDYAATTPLDARVLARMQEVAETAYGNPSSVHAFGRRARNVLEEGREQLARLLGAKYDEVIFTSGGTEADNAALMGAFAAARNSGRTRILISAVEHHAVLHAASALRAQGADVVILPVDAYGAVRMDALRSALTANTCLVSIMHANNEVGTIQPIAEIAAAAHARGALVHTDAVQSFGKIPADVNALGVDLLSISAHKIYGPKGIGALYLRKGARVEPILHGGGQEMGRRPGTENIAAAAGLALAAHLMEQERPVEEARLRNLRARLLKQAEERLPGIVVNGHPSETLPTIASLSFDAKRWHLDGDAVIMAMDLQEVAVTSGSACTAGSLQASHVLLAMGRDEATARSTVRFSFGRQTTIAEVDRAIEALGEIVERMQGSEAGTIRS